MGVAEGEAERQVEPEGCRPARPNLPRTSRNSWVVAALVRRRRRLCRGAFGTPGAVRRWHGGGVARPDEGGDQREENHRHPGRAHLWRASLPADQARDFDRSPASQICIRTNFGREIFLRTATSSNISLSWNAVAETAQTGTRLRSTAGHGRRPSSRRHGRPVQNLGAHYGQLTRPARAGTVQPHRSHDALAELRN